MKAESIAEYGKIAEAMISRKQGRRNRDILLPLVRSMHVVPTVSGVKICRDPADDKFINFAMYLA